MQWVVLPVLSCLLLTSRTTAGDWVPLRVLEDLPGTGYGNLQHVDTKHDDRLQLRMKPANLSGPEHLRDWLGRCFKHRDSKYEYVFCPFQNFTQEDVQTYYDPYKGVLGVWADWEIRDNQYQAMNMIEGSPCANGTHRSTKVFLRCGKQPELMSIEEPQKCRYQAVFRSPEVCGVNALVVYPRLPKHLQARWDQAEHDYTLGYTTHKGYEKELERIFIEGGLVLTAEARMTLLQKTAAESTQNCQVDLQALQLRVSQLEEELRAKEEIIRELQDGRRDV